MEPWNPNQTHNNSQSPPAHPEDAKLGTAYPAVTPPAHPDSSRDPLYAHLNISRGEHVLREVERHVIGVLQIYVVSALAILGILIGTGVLINFASKPQADLIAGTTIAIPAWAILLVGGMLAALAVVITAIAVKVFYGNRLYLTNESVIQRIQTSLFHTKEQQITLGNIEDASYERRGILQQMLNYGTIRLSTEGEETTYYFHYAKNPKFEVGQIIQAQEDFNNLNPSTKH